jgi:hypothetical protein
MPFFLAIYLVGGFLNMFSVLAYGESKRDFEDALSLVV